MKSDFNNNLGVKRARLLLSWPVEGIVNVREDVEKMDRIEFSEAISYGVHTGKN